MKVCVVLTAESPTMRNYCMVRCWGCRYLAFTMLFYYGLTAVCVTVCFVDQLLLSVAMCSCFVRLFSLYRSQFKSILTKLYTQSGISPRKMKFSRPRSHERRTGELCELDTS